jgi:hypothetical protein
MLSLNSPQVFSRGLRHQHVIPAKAGIHAEREKQVALSPQPFFWRYR